MQISELTMEDLESAAALLEAYCSELPWDETALFTYLMREDALLYAAREGEQLIGFTGLLMAPPEADILDVTVQPEFRRQGVASTLLETLFENAKTRGVDTIFLEVRAGNEPAKALYRKMDFREAGIRKGYYTDPAEDAVVMQRQEGT